MGLVITTAPALEPVSRDEMKAWLRVDSASDAMDILQSILPGSHAVAAAYSLEGASVDVLGYTATVFLNAGTCGASGTVAAKIQESANASTWTDWTGGGFTTVTEANDNAVQEKAYTGDKRYIRVVATVATAACEFGAEISRQALTTVENDLLDAIVKAARGYCEDFTRRSFVTTVLTLSLDSFPAEIVLPRAPVQAVNTIKYLNTAGTQVTLDDSLYRVDVTDEPTRITPAYGCTWPSTYGVISAVEVEFDAGYGDAATDVPDGIRTAIKLLAAQWYENREASGPDSVKEAPLAVKSLLWQHRAMVI